MRHTGTFCLRNVFVKSAESLLLLCLTSNESVSKLSRYINDQSDYEKLNPKCRTFVLRQHRPQRDDQLSDERRPKQGRSDHRQCLVENPIRLAVMHSTSAFGCNHIFHDHVGVSATRAVPEHSNVVDYDFSTATSWVKRDFSVISHKKSVNLP